MPIEISETDFDIGREHECCRRRLGGQPGAIVSFTGLVRDVTSDEDVIGLHLEHYPGMTEKSIQNIVCDAKQRWDLLDVVVIHRIGSLQPRDQIVLVVVASAHRPDAFAACEYIMDFLKTEAVFWKKESRKGKDVWIKSTLDDAQRRAEWRKN